MSRSRRRPYYFSNFRYGRRLSQWEFISSKTIDLWRKIKCLWRSVRCTRGVKAASLHHRKMNASWFSTPVRPGFHSVWWWKIEIVNGDYHEIIFKLANRLKITRLLGQRVICYVWLNVINDLKMNGLQNSATDDKKLSCLVHARFKSTFSRSAHRSVRFEKLFPNCLVRQKSMTRAS